MTITALPTPPLRSDTPDDFVTKADAFIAALPTFVTQLNAEATALNTALSALPISAASLTFSTTAGGDPGAGGLRFGNADVSLATTITISEQTAAAVSLVNLLNFMDDSTSTTSKGIIKLYKTSDSTKYVYLAILSIADNGSYRTITLAGASNLGAISYSSTAPFANADGLTLQFWPLADVGSIAGGVTLTNTNITGIREATFDSEIANATTTGAITVNWTNGHVQNQAEPTGGITYTFTAPTSNKPCHLSLRIVSDGTSTAQTFTWPGTVKWLGAQWAAANNKNALINFYFDGSTYWAAGANEA